MNTRSRSQAGSRAPSTASQRQSRKAHSSHSQHPEEDRSQETDGIRVRLYAAVLPVVDLLSDSADTPAVVLELASSESKSGLRRATVSWHGPFANTEQASSFVAQLASLQATTKSAPIEGRADRDA